MNTSSTWNRALYGPITLAVLFFIAVVLFAQPSDDPDLNVLKMGLGSGSVNSADGRISCGADCTEPYSTSDTVVLTASPDPGSTFAGWDTDADGDTSTSADCSANPCTLSMSAARSVRATFDLSTPIPTLGSFTPEGIQSFLTANPSVNSPARFVKALPDIYKQNWILMTRSESLQTGTAEFPRILLPSENAQSVFTIALATHGSYPGAHPNAIEYMQWDATQKNFRFHEIVLDAIPSLDPDSDGVGVIPARARGVSADDAKCPRCHSTRNVLNLNRTVSPPVPGSAIGTDGIPPGTVKTKNKPNWDAYDSWGGMTPFNRDRIYQGSVEAADFRKFFNPWTWRTNDTVRTLLEQLRLQPPGVVASDRITRWKGGTNDGLIRFAFDGSTPVLTEPAPTSSGVGIEAPISTNYGFDGAAGSGATTSVTRGGTYVFLHHTSDVLGTGVGVEGRGVQLFDLLGGLDGNLNPLRIADELINHHFATGSVPIDVRPIALAISKLQPCLSINSATNSVVSNPSVMPALPALTIDLTFFNTRNGMSINELVADTRTRTQSVPRRKADIEKRDLDRTNDPYLWGNPSPSPAIDGLIQKYGATTSSGVDTSLDRLRREVFRRPSDLGAPDSTVMGGIYVDREDYAFNTNRVALYRYFLEPLGVSVDKWSMGVRGRSRTYSFADVFSTYRNTLDPEISADLTAHPAAGLASTNCNDLINFMNSMSLPDASGPGAIPKYTDVQRIFNKSCIECHGGLDYPPYQNFGTLLDLTEDETPPAGMDRLDRSYNLVTSGFVSLSGDPRTSFLYQRICPGAGSLPSPDAPCAVPSSLASDDERCPFGLMPCGGPRLSHTDIATIRRWIVGGAPNTRGDPHLETVDGVPYDFQSAGEFVLLRGQGLEIQSRQAPVTTAGPLGPNDHTGLSSCVSINTAAAVRVGTHRITYQPNSNGEPDPKGMQLRIDGKLSTLTNSGIFLDTGGRIIQTSVAGGIQIEAPGGTIVDITPHFWEYYQVWFLNIDVHHARATDGVMGVIPRGNWLPTLPDGTPMGPRPRDLHQRYLDLYDKFENAWRVTNSNSLFDYAPGTSTATFQVDSWPAENPTVCTAPPRPPGGPLTKTPLKALTFEVAQQHCGPLAGERAKANCIQDVMVTGDPAFAQVYIRGEEVERNAAPNPPVLGFPGAFQTDVTPSVNFTWDKTVDREGDPLIYRHCVWDVKERFTFDKCMITGSAGSTSLRGGITYGVIVLIVGLLLFLILIWLGVKKKPMLLYLLLVLLVAGVVVAFFIGRHRTGSTMLARDLSGLQSGRSYYWKVIAEDGKGGTVESETRRFEVR